MSTQPVFVSVRIVAQMLGVPERTVRFWCASGKFDVIRPGHAILIRRTSVEALINGAAKQQPAA